MKRILTTSLLTLGLLSGAAFSDIAVYDGKTRVNGTSGALSGTVSVRTIQVVDTATGETQAINLLKLGKLVKKFAIAPKVQSSLASVSDKKSKKVNTVISFADVTTSVENVQFTGSLLLKGKDANVNIKGTDKVSLPKVLQGSTTLVVKAAPGQPTDSNALVLAASVLKLDTDASKAANDATPALTLDETVEQIRQDLLADTREGGYEEVDTITSFPGF